MTRKPAALSFNLLAICVLTGVLAMTCFSVFAAGSDLEEIIQEKISERHPTDTPVWWQSLGPEAPHAIIALYGKTQGIYQRLRLVEALGWYHDPEAIAFLKKQAESSQQDAIRNGAIQSVGNAAGASETDFIAGFLSHDDPQTRVAAGQALRKIATPKANTLLEKFYQKEQMPWVKDRIQEAPVGVPKSRGPLLRLSSKAPDSLKPEFAGNWKGILVLPASSSTGLMQIDAQAKTQIENATNLKGDIKFQLAPVGGTNPQTPRSIVLQFSQATGKDIHVSGWLKGDVLKELGSKEPKVHFDGELQEKGDTRILKFESREILLTIILR
ncbi:MAG: HEAT repeat domain-containing protein [Bdellovibrionia bacterium]